MIKVTNIIIETTMEVSWVEDSSLQQIIFFSELSF